MVKRVPSQKAAKPNSKRSSVKKARKRGGKLPATEPSTYTVFISHSSKEKWIARQISKEIMGLGAKTWLDLKDLRSGDEIRRSINIASSHSG